SANPRRNYARGPPPEPEAPPPDPGPARPRPVEVRDRPRPRRYLPGHPTDPPQHRQPKAAPDGDLRRVRPRDCLRGTVAAGPGRGALLALSGGAAGSAVRPTAQGSPAGGRYE